MQCSFCHAALLFAKQACAICQCTGNEDISTGSYIYSSQYMFSQGQCTGQCFFSLYIYIYIYIYISSSSSSLPYIANHHCMNNSRPRTIRKSTQRLCRRISTFSGTFGKTSFMVLCKSTCVKSWPKQRYRIRCTLTFTKCLIQLTLSTTVHFTFSSQVHEAFQCRAE